MNNVPLFEKVWHTKKEHYSNFCTFEIVSLLNVLGHYLRKYGNQETNGFLKYSNLCLQTDENGAHQQGHWGYCDKIESDCPFPNRDIFQEMRQSINDIGDYLLAYFSKCDKAT